MPVYIEKYGDLVGCYHSGTTKRKDRATQPMDHGLLRWANPCINFDKSMYTFNNFIIQHPHPTSNNFGKSNNLNKIQNEEPRAEEQDNAMIRLGFDKKMAELTLATRRWGRYQPPQGRQLLAPGKGKISKRFFLQHSIRACTSNKKVMVILRIAITINFL